MPDAPSRADAEETRRAILRAEQELFAAAGYRAVTTRMVAKVSGIKQPLIYYHFADKEALYVEVQRERALACRAALEYIAGQHDMPIPERLRAVVAALRASHQSNMSLFMHDVQHELSEQARATLSELFRANIVQPIMAIFAEGIASGFLRKPEQGGVAPRLATFLLLSAIMHLPEVADVERGADPRADLDASAADALIHALLYGMAAAPPG